MDQWVHVACVNTTNALSFATCLRCKLPVTTQVDAIQTCCGSVRGYIHLKCSKKRKAIIQDLTKEPNA